MRTHLLAVSLCLFGGLLAASPAEAQYGARRSSSNRATGETYHVEAAGTIWNPSPDIIISSEGLGQLGDNIDFVNTLGIEQKKFKQLKLVLRPGTKHKFRFEYTPISYMVAQKTVPTTFVFNGQRFNVGIPVATDVTWKAYRFGYEWDFVYKDRGFAGVVVETKYTDITATLTSAAVGAEQFTSAHAPIPAVGFIGRGYVVPNISITGEFTFFKLPDKALNSDDYSGKYYDFDLYGTVNFNENLGAQLGYRSFDVFYKVKQDTGTLKLKGLYFGGVARF
ncbi:MAG TPA: hypothetical protein VEL51_09945 [Vicinamibacterales bacterium]|nr:hypothetical protein [Vicinamibacterales bacterium]